ncbi:hypothetical protein ABZX66_04140 [Micromonospora aurantiaca]|uniref:hypothetical protein n=1 Tax=Micromonospora aurantiaca (nom. illeg.) TaxID=47850 RepID=UPI0033AF61E0
MASIRVRQARDGDRAALTALHEREWGGPIVVVHDTRYDLRDLPALVAVDDGGGFAGALRFYQRRGLRIVTVDAGAVDRARAVKQTIPQVGADGIPLHDELRLARHLTGAGNK